MILTNMRMSNFRQVKAENVDLRGHDGVVFVHGRNDTKVNADSNMAGKTTLLNALTWCLFGCDATGKAISESAIRHGQAKCIVECKFKTKGRWFRIGRWRERIGTPSVIVYIDVSKDAVVWKEQNKGTPDDMQHRIDFIFGVKALFLAAHVFTTDEGTTPFAMQTDTAKKQLFDLLISSEDLELAREKTRKELKAEITKRDKFAAERSNVRSVIDALTENHQERVDDQGVVLFDLKTKRNKLFNMRSVLQTECEDRRSNLDSMKICISSMSRQAEKVMEEATRKREEATHVSNPQAGEAFVHGVNLLAGKRTPSLSCFWGAAQLYKKCPICKQGIGAPALKVLLAECDARALRLRTAEKDAQVAYEAAEKQVRTFRHSQLQRTREYRDLLTEQHDMMNRISRLSGQHDMLREEIDRLEGDKKEADAAWKKQLKEATSTQVELGMRIQAAERRAHALRFWMDGFGPKGIKAYRIERVLPLMNRLALQYSDLLYGDGTRVEYATQTQGSTGKLREEFQIALVNGAGPVAAPSAGQVQRRNIIHTLVIADVAVSIGCRTLDLEVFDEVFKTLDSQGTDAVVTLLREREKRVHTMLLVEHDAELSSRFNHTLTAWCRPHDRKNGYPITQYTWGECR